MAEVIDLVAHVRDGGLLDGAGRVTVLLSGGRDSTALADVCVQVAGAGRVEALHVDYGLRAGSAAEADHCRALCARLGIPVTVATAGPAPATGNLQGWARDVRYGIAAGRTAGRPDHLLAVGHTADDQAETVLYRLAAAPGRRALLGMDERRGALVRPLLGVTRDQTGAWCRARDLAWVDDPGNDTGRFARGRVRHGLLPALHDVHPAARDNLLRTVAVLREEAAVLDELVDGRLAGGDRIALDDLAAAGPAVGRLILRRLAERATGGLCPRAAARLPDVLALGDRGMLDLGDGARACVTRGVLVVERTPALPGRMAQGDPPSAGLDSRP